MPFWDPSDAFAQEKSIVRAENRVHFSARCSRICAQQPADEAGSQPNSKSHGAMRMTAIAATADAPIVDRLSGGPGVSAIDPADPAAPYLQLLSRLRSPLTLRELMIRPVRTG